MAFAIVSVRLIDLAIFASLGGLWIAGAVFIVLLYRWILRFEQLPEAVAFAHGRDAAQPEPGPETPATPESATVAAPAPRPRLQPAPMRHALGQQA